MGVRRDRLWSWAIAGVVILIAVVIMSVFLSLSVPRVNLQLGDGIFKTTLAISDNERQRGLSGRSGLDSGEAMLLIFERDDKWPIWMKDMHFAIDIIWINSDKEVVHIVKNARPESYPDRQFAPRSAAKYVLEVPAGTVAERNIRVGNVAKFDLSQRLGIFE